MELPFRTCAGKIYNITLDPEITVGQAKPIISEQTKVPLKLLKLTIHFKPLLDNIKIKDINLPVGGLISVVNSTIRQPPNSETRSLRRPASLKTIQKIENASAKDPPNFQDLVLHLTDMGYPKDMCEKALRVSFYNIDRAAELLVMKSDPEKKQQPAAVKHTTQSMAEIPMPFTLEDIKNISEISKECDFPEKTTMQVYLACDKNKKSTQKCLCTMEKF